MNLSAANAAVAPGLADGFSHESSPRAALVGLGVAVPELSVGQGGIEQRMARLWSLQGSSLARWRRIVAGSGIVMRHAVLPPEQVVRLTTQERMAAYETHAPALAERAARHAMRDSNIDAAAITDLVVVSCTGFSAPGVDIALMDLLGLPCTVRRTLIGFMGCFGAITGLRTALGACAAHHNAVVLVVSVELCSLHMRNDDSPDNQVASALFSDGAAAAVLRSDSRTDQNGWSASSRVHGHISSGGSLLISEGKDWMSWRITDSGFKMTLTRDVPLALRERLAWFISDVAGDAPPRSFAIHPGGPGILDAAENALKLCPTQGIEVSRRVLRDFGNMSSATVLFVLRQMVLEACELPTLLLAFGPGLTIESIMLGP